MLNETNQIIAVLAELPLLLIISAVVLLVAVWVSVHSIKHSRELEKTIRQLRSDQRAMTTAAVGMGGRVLELERRLKNMREHQEQQHVDIYDSANQPYEHAIQMAKHGASIQELVDMCGVSHNEAELITMMHRLDKTA